MKHFITTQDWTKQELEEMLELAASLKKKNKQTLPGKSLCMLFFNNSLRTRTSFIQAMYELGGNAISMSVGTEAWPLEYKENTVMDGAAEEHVKDAVSVLSRYNDAIAVRKFAEKKNWEQEKKDLAIKSFAKYSKVPVINMESSVYHPCQALADIMTIKEHLGDVKGKKLVLTWAYHPKPLMMSVANSALLIATKFGMDVTVAHPEEYDLDPDIMASAKQNAEQAEGSVTVCNDMDVAFDQADVVYAKSWGPYKYYGNWEQEQKLREKLKYWKVTTKKMDLTNNAKFMHCLPVKRNVIVDDAVMDSKNSIVYDEAENRLHAQKALLTKLVADK